MASDTINYNFEMVDMIPQKPPIVMVDKITHCDGNRTLTIFKINEDNIFCQNGVLREPGLIENIAQSAAARVGYICMTEKIPVPVGYIGAIKDLVINKLPPIGSVIETEIVLEHDVFDISLISGHIRLDNELIATCEMKIFLKKEVEPPTN